MESQYGKSSGNSEEYKANLIRRMSQAGRPSSQFGQVLSARVNRMSIKLSRKKKTMNEAKAYGEENFQSE